MGKRRLSKMSNAFSEITRGKFFYAPLTKSLKIYQNPRLHSVGVLFMLKIWSQNRFTTSHGRIQVELMIIGFDTTSLPLSCYDQNCLIIQCGTERRVHLSHVTSKPTVIENGSFVIGLFKDSQEYQEV